MACHCSGCMTASRSCSSVSETFPIQTENPLFVLHLGLNFNGKFGQNQLCHLPVRGGWINIAPLFIAKLLHLTFSGFYFGVCLLFAPETHRFRSGFLLPAANVQTLNCIPEGHCTVFCTSRSFYSANSYRFSYMEKNWQGTVLSEQQWSKTWDTWI